MFPHSIIMLIVDPSGCGKTCLLMKMLFDENLLNYSKLYVFARSLYLPEYQILKNGISNGLRKKDMIELMDAE